MKVSISSYWGSVDSPCNRALREGHITIEAGLYALAYMGAASGNYDFRIIEITTSKLVVSAEFMYSFGNLRTLSDAPENHYWYLHTFTRDSAMDDFGLMTTVAAALRTSSPNDMAPKELVTDL